jgi:hypothetical protein
VNKVLALTAAVGLVLASGAAQAQFIGLPNWSPPPPPSFNVPMMPMPQFNQMPQYQPMPMPEPVPSYQPPPIQQYQPPQQMTCADDGFGHMLCQ